MFNQILQQKCENLTHTIVKVILVFLFFLQTPQSGKKRFLPFSPFSHPSVSFKLSFAASLERLLGQEMRDDASGDGQISADVVRSFS